MTASRRSSEYARGFKDALRVATGLLECAIPANEIEKRLLERLAVDVRALAPEKTRTR